jgi:hypothetical protein
MCISMAFGAGSWRRSFRRQKNLQWDSEGPLGGFMRCSGWVKTSNKKLFSAWHLKAFSWQANILTGLSHPRIVQGFGVTTKIYSCLIIVKGLDFRACAWTQTVLSNNTKYLHNVGMRETCQDDTIANMMSTSSFYPRVQIFEHGLLHWTSRYKSLRPCTMCNKKG